MNFTQASQFARLVHDARLNFRRPLRLLDLFCGAGGAAMGYAQAFPDAEIVGVDINPQPRYPFTFEKGDAMKFLWLRSFDLIHASPPCQDWSTLKTAHSGHGTAWMLPETIRRLSASGVPWVVENVAGADMGGNFITLCGSSFGLGVRRHRNFATSFPVMAPPCAHYLQPEPVDVTGTGGPTPGRVRTGGGVSREPRDLAHAREVMGIDWMNRRELSQAIPPAYTRWIGEQWAESLIEHPFSATLSTDIDDPGDAANVPGSGKEPVGGSPHG